MVRSRAAGLAALATALLAACGGGADDDAHANGADTTAAQSEQSASEREQAAAFYPTGPIPANAPTRGMWSPVYRWPLIPVHMLLLPDGRLLSYGTRGDGTQTGFFEYDIWDGLTRPDQAAGHLTLPNRTGTDIFCSAQILLPNQSSMVFLAGGDNWTGTSTTNTGNNNTTSFNAATNVLSRGPNMNRPRWYATTTTLVNGEVYIQGGSGGTDRAEVRQLNGSFRFLTASTSALDYYYPRNFVAPNGQVFGFETNGRMYYVNPAGNGSVREVGRLDTAYTGFASSAAMYRPGKILQVGGTNSNGAVTIDITGAAPVVRTTGSLSQQRAWVNTTVLPNGKVLATGGSPIANWYGGANNLAEIWDPQTGAWTQGNAGALARMYHSTAILLPDASVLVGGGGAPGPLTNTNVEVYYPPYLFNAQAKLAARPTITSAPTVLDIGRTFNVGVGYGPGVGRVVLIKTGSVTHSFNMEQRFLDLTYQASGNTLAVQAPTRAVDATPGYYMLFVLDRAGVPSVAKIVKLNIASNPNPAVAPTITTPGNQTGTVDTALTLQLQGRDPNGDTLRYGATGLPTGLTLNATTGLISGKPTRAGHYNVVVSVTDGVNAASASFTWSIADKVGPLTIDDVSSPEATLKGTEVSYTARATGVDVRYKWSYGDGSADSDWSRSGRTTHTYRKAGTYYVTLSVDDDRGIVQTHTFLQIVGLPLTDRAPSISNSLLYEKRKGNDRLWVVNPDNDSVSVLDATDRSLLAEIETGDTPRSVARTSSGEIWVTNKLAATISVIDPEALKVVRTIALDRASMPYGIAISPTERAAFVALEATGRVLKLSTRNDAVLGSVAVGATPRHLSVDATGSTVYVSRYITPPLPGEATQTVDTSGNVGGVVVKVDAATLKRTGQIILKHSDKPDFENQGRGIPNYLGAPVISPDGTQAWVPSKQDNIKRGSLRDGAALNFQSTVRAISSRIVLSKGREDLAKRVDHDNASVASAAVFDPRGVYLFVALETSRDVAVVDAHSGREILRFDVGRAPQGLTLSSTGRTLYVHNYMDRSIGIYDLRPLLERGDADVPRLDTVRTVKKDALSATVLKGKQLFYDARDPRLSRDRYMSCATCHNDGGHDGRVWDFTGQGEGLRNTTNLRGRAGQNGFLHWSANFDEVQDFEGQIRALGGGTGLMSDADFTAGTRSEPLGDRKAGVSDDLDALAAYVGSLRSYDATPWRPSTTALSSAASSGKSVFRALNCAACHAGTSFTGSGQNTTVDIGTLKPSSGHRLGGTLSGIDIPTLRDVWATAPYLHDGSAATLADAIKAHKNLSVSKTDLSVLVSYLREIGREESAAPQKGGTGQGLQAEYFDNAALDGKPTLKRVEAIDFDWGTGRPVSGVDRNQFSVRWSGKIEAPATGTYWFQTVSDEGVRVRINGRTIISNWTAHTLATDSSAAVNLVAGRQYDISVEYYDLSGAAEMRLRWRPPGYTSFGAVPESRLYER